MAVDQWIAIPAIRSTANVTREWVTIITGVMMVLGALWLLAIQGKDFVQGTPGKWYYGLLVVIGLAIQAGVGILLGSKSGSYQWLVNSFYDPLVATMFSTLGFYIVSAAIRAFQARNWQSGVFLLAACFVVLSNIPMIAATQPWLAEIGYWVNAVPGKAGIRGIMTVAAIGGIILAIRTLTGRDIAYLGRA
jgi:hypothetical protein